MPNGTFIIDWKARNFKVFRVFLFSLVDQQIKSHKKYIRLSWKISEGLLLFQGTIRVPAPVQYARKHAQLVALNLHKKAADQLRDKLFYL